jgi:hypothetical protein
MKIKESTRKIIQCVSLIKTIRFLLVVCFTCSCAEQQEIKKMPIPIIYSTDLYHPPQDPDDHYDLATLFMMHEFDIKAFIFDLSTAHRQPDEYGHAALEQIAAITHRPLPPHAIGLRQPLISQSDKAEYQPSEFQGGVDLILQALRVSNEKVVLFLTGSCRDFAAAYNREPELLRQKVSAIYVNAGNGPNGKQDEWNVKLDPNAYLCLLTSDLPICWCPCFPRGHYVQAVREDIEENNAITYNTCFIIPNQAEWLKNVSVRLQNYFNYALTASTEDPIQYLERSPGEISNKPRNMWCTGPFIHAAGRRIYTGQGGGYIACSLQEAQKKGISDKEVKVFSFEAIRLSPKTSDDSSEQPVFQGDLKARKSSTKVFHYIHPDYNDIMVSALSNILETY